MFQKKIQAKLIAVCGTGRQALFKNNFVYLILVVTFQWKTIKFTTKKNLIFVNIIYIYDYMNI